MSYIIISSNNSKVVKRLNKLENGTLQHPKTSELFISAFNMGNNNKEKSRSGTVKVMKNNGISWTYISALLIEFPLDVQVFISNQIMLPSIPKIFHKTGKWFSDKKGRHLKDACKAVDMTNEELKNHSVDSDGKLKIRKP